MTIGGVRPRLALILSCSARKLPRQGLAIYQYDGTAFRIMRRFEEKRRGLGWPRVFVLSARYGLISEERQITEYDQVMTDDRAKELAWGDLERAERTLYLHVPEVFGRRPHPPFDHFGHYYGFFCFAGETYRKVLTTWESRGLFRAAPLEFASGAGIGEMLRGFQTRLERWAREEG